MGKSFLYGNGGDSIDTSQITATQADIIQGKTAFIDDSGEVKSGVIPINSGLISGTNHLECDENIVVGNYSLDNKQRLYIRPTAQITSRQAYEADTWFTKETSKLAPHLGITADKIVKGNTICGVDGTASKLDQINGTKGTYYAYAGQNIQAGDFIKFITGVSGVGAGSAQWRDIASGRALLDVGTVNSNQILVISCDSSYNTYATLIYIDGVEFIVQSEVSIGNSSTYYTYVKLVNYGNGYFTIIRASSSTSMYTGLVNISGSTINVIADLSKNYRNLSTISDVISIANHAVDAGYRGNVAPLAKALSGTNYFTMTAFGTSSTGARMHMLFYVDYSNGSVTYVNGTWSYGTGSTSGSRSFAFSPNGTMFFSIDYYGSTAGVIQKYTISTSGIVREASLSNPWSSGSNAKSCCYYSDTQGFVINDAQNSVASITPFTQSGSSFVVGASVVLDSTYGNALAGWGLKLNNGVNILLHTRSNNTVGVRTISISNNTVTLIALKDITGISDTRLKHGVRLTQNLIGGKFLIFDTLVNTSYTDSKVMVLNSPTANTIDTINYLYETQIAKSNNRYEINGVSLGSAIGGTNTGASAGHNQAAQVVTI